MKTTFLYFGLLTTISPLSLKVRCLKYCIYLSLWAGLKTYMFKNSAPPLAQSLYSDTEICGRRRDVCSLWCVWGSRRICECLSPSHGRRGNLRSALAHTSLSDVNASITGVSQSQRSQTLNTSVWLWLHMRLWLHMLSTDFALISWSDFVWEET